MNCDHDRVSGIEIFSMSRIGLQNAAVHRVGVFKVPKMYLI